MLSISHQDFKTASTKMSSELKEAGITIQHSRLLNMMAHSFGYKDYATFRGLSNQSVIESNSHKSKTSKTGNIKAERACQKYGGLSRFIHKLTREPGLLPYPLESRDEKINIEEMEYPLLDSSKNKGPQAKSSINATYIRRWYGYGNASFFETDIGRFPVRLRKIVTECLFADKGIKGELNAYDGRGNIILVAPPGVGKTSIIDALFLPKVKGKIARLYGMTPYQHMTEPCFYSKPVTWFYPTSENIETIQAHYDCVVIDDIGEFKEEPLRSLLENKKISVIVSCQGTAHTKKEIDILFDTAYYNPMNNNPTNSWTKTYPEIC